MENADKPLPPTALIADAMFRLSVQAKDDPLGYSQEPSEKLEKKFQLEFCKLLNELTPKSGWTWRQEVKYRTYALRNKGTISIDIVGRYRSSGNSAAIELKYVPTRQDDKGAPNPLAFPYDLLKDCLKIELIPTEHCEPVEQTSYDQLAFGYSIGLTNFSGILNETMQGWSKNFLAMLQPREASENGNDFSIGPCTIEAFSPNAIEEVIYARKRHHVSLGMTWTGKWTRFGDTNFHYVMLSTTFDRSPKYLHCVYDSKFIPFLTDKVRDYALRKAADLGKIKTTPVEIKESGKGPIQISAKISAQKNSPDTSASVPVGCQMVGDSNLTGPGDILLTSGPPAHSLLLKKQTLWCVLKELRTCWPAWRTVDFPKNTDNQLQMRRGPSMVSIRLLNNAAKTNMCGVAMRFIQLRGLGDDEGPLLLSQPSLDSLRSVGIHLEIAGGRSTLKQEIAFDIPNWEELKAEDSNRIATTVVDRMMEFTQNARKTMEREGLMTQLAGWFSHE